MSGTSSTPAPVTTGNNLLSPPRLTGNAQQDASILLRWMNDFYDRVVKVANVIGTQQQLADEIATLQAQVKIINTHLGL